MKRLSLNLLFLLLACWVQAQTQMTINGTVSRISDGSPVANWFVLVYGGDSADSTVSVFGEGYTNQDGEYSILVDVPPGISELTVFTFNDCANNPLGLEEPVSVNPGTATVNFSICADSPPMADCEAWIWYQPAGGLALNFFADFFTANGAAADQYLWDFGDGTTSNEANPLHVYATEGLYTVTLTATSSTGCTATVTEQVFVSEQPPVPECWAWIDMVPGNDSLTYNFSAYYYGIDSLATAAEYFWTFGDGTTSTEANPTHTYADEGFYFVQVTVTGANGCVAVAEFPFSTDFPPYPECLAYISYEQTGTTSFNFDGHAYGVNGDTTNIISYSWDFGDGATSTEANPSHTYADENLYVVQLTVVTDDSCEAYACEIVMAYNCPIDTFWYGCQAMFNAGFGGFPDPNGNPGNNGDPLTVSFYDLSFGAVETWAWDFGDGATSDEQNPTHTYAQDGIYTVTLSITTLDGCESEASFEIYVGDDFPWAPEPDCQALFIPLPDSIGGNGIQFIDVSFSQGVTLEWTWDFGDGATSNEQNPYHVYAQPGIYTVLLEIESDSCNSVISFEVDTQNPWNFNQQPAKLGVAGGTTAIKENPAFKEVKVFPNPATTEINVAFTMAKAGNYELRITDLSGKTLDRVQQYAQTGANLARLNISQLTPGLYMAELRSSDQVKTFKFVRQ